MSNPDNQKVRQAVAKQVIEAKTASQASIVTHHQLTVQQQVHRGPLPPPEVLKHYNDAIPNGAERIMAMAEREQSHTHGLERRLVALTMLGQVGGFILIASAIFGAFYLVMHNKPIEAFFSFFSGLGILLGGGYLSRKRSSASPEKKTD